MVVSFGKYESTDTCAFGKDKNPVERIHQLLLKSQKQMDDYNKEMWNDRNTFKTSGENEFERFAQIKFD